MSFSSPRHDPRKNPPLRINILYQVKVETFPVMEMYTTRKSAALIHRDVVKEVGALLDVWLGDASDQLEEEIMKALTDPGELDKVRIQFPQPREVEILLRIKGRPIIHGERSRKEIKRLRLGFGRLLEEKIDISRGYGYVDGHVNCPCWRSGAFAMVDGCRVHRDHKED